MTTTAYPSSLLPRPLNDGYGLQQNPVTVRTEMDAGMPRVRRRFGRSLTLATLCWNFTRAEYAIFDGWYRNILLDGTAWFQIQLRNGYADQLWTCRGVNVPAAKPPLVDVWNVSWQVEVDDIPSMSVAEIEALEIGSTSILTEAGEDLLTEDGLALVTEG